MTDQEMRKELWSLANLVTGFSVAQSIGVTIAMGDDLGQSLQRQPPGFKFKILIVALLCSFAYTYAINQCRILALSLGKEHNSIWSRVNAGRISCVFLFTAVFGFGLFAPEIFPKTPEPSVKVPAQVTK